MAYSRTISHKFSISYGLWLGFSTVAWDPMVRLTEKSSTIQTGRLMDWEQSCGERLWDIGGRKIQPEPAICNCSPENQSYPGLHTKKCDQQVKREDFPPLLCSLGYCIQLWDLQHKKETDLSEQVQWKITKVVRGLEHVSYEERLSK